MKKFLIIGNGVGGATAAENIRKHDKESSIVMVTNEDFPFYYRIRLNEYIAGDIKEDDLRARDEKWYDERKIELMLNTRISGKGADEKTVVTEEGRQIPWDSLLIATGSHSFVPPIKGVEKKGVFSLRSLQDARNISEWAGNVENVVLIGGGLLGLEAGNALRKIGKKVTVVEFFPRLLPRQLDEEGAKRLQGIMEDMGFSFRLGAKTEAISGDDTATHVQLDGGDKLPAQMAIISAGVRSNIELAESIGLDHDKGIKVDERLRTSKEGIYAAGDVAEFRGMTYGIWPAAMDQGRIAGANMTGADEKYEGTTMANTLKVVGIDLASAGNIDAENEYDSEVVATDLSYKKIVIHEDKIIGCIMLGDTKDFNRINKAIAKKENFSLIKDQIL
ncbi:MAG: FAD-dependent oxidoreductase [Desulfatiglans sp.]|jgi:nitrite reductase (NADH) large subunit|nr:FAD-dependent oxidoreductase [Thermodesulfobacteriota bacterium]MEE4354789.1 FAD-dependent oxidoreductase [Desulfatiglans sp.]